MISDLGRGLVLLALLFATVGSIAGFVAGSRRNRRAWGVARNSTLLFAGSMIGANLLMVYALLIHDFSVGYVAQVGSLDTPWHITVVSLWSSLEGSILFWGGVLGVYAAALVVAMGDKHREYMPWTLHVLLAIAVFFSFLVASVADPFHPVSPVPLDGPGPNALLQNHWLMAVHPPTLYLGYVGMSVPYAMLCAALLTGRLEDGWIVPLRRWMLIPWMFLTVGIVLGGWWSYGVLGWGGYWAWDPVENASFHPWLTGTAFLHSAMVLQRRGILRDWTITLGMSTFLLTLVGTFMTRSGVFNSVHSFTQSEIGPAFLIFIAIVLSYSVLLVAFRSHTLEDSHEESNEELGALGTLVGSKMSFSSREFSILLQNGLFAVFTFTVLLGTLYPLIAEALQDRKVSVGEPYFDRWALPLGIGLVFLMGVGPALPWGNLRASAAGRRLGLPVLTGLVITAIAFALGVTLPFTLLSLFVCGFALHANLAEFVDPVLARMQHRDEAMPVAAANVLRRARRRFGGHVAHLGVILAVVAIALSRGYRDEKTTHMVTGQTENVGDFTVTFLGARLDKEPHRHKAVASFQIDRHGTTLGVYEPSMNHYPNRREPIGSPAVYSTPETDVYLSITELPRDGSFVVIRMMTMPAVMWLWVAPFVIAFGVLMSVWPSRRRRQSVQRTAPLVGERAA